MKRIPSLLIKSLITILIGSGILATNLQAQSVVAVTASIPFPFTVGAQRIEPGTYRFSLVSDQFLLSVLNVKTGDIKMFTVRPEQQRAVKQEVGLIFRNSAGGRVLNEVHFPGTDTFSELIERPAQKRSLPSSAVAMAQR